MEKHKPEKGMPRETEAATDDELLARAATGDARERDAVWEELHRRHHRLVFHEVMDTVGNVGRAEEIAQEVMLEAMQKAPTYARTASFASWLRTLARARAIDHMRSEYGRYRRRRIFSLDGLEPYEKDRMLQDEQSPGPLHRADEDERREAIYAAIDALPDRLRVVVRMTLEGKTLKKIGEKLGVTEGRASQLLKEAKAKMRKRIEASLAPPPPRTVRGREIVRELRPEIAGQASQASAARQEAENRAAAARKKLDDLMQ